MDKYELRIKEYRKLRGLTQSQLAVLVGISQNFLSEIENGKYDIGLNLLIEIAEVLDIYPLDLIDYTYKK